MKLVEVVMLVGAHCVSPVEQSQMMTDATKVQCAVVIEKDTEKGTLTVTPPDAAADPLVAAAVARFGAAPVDPFSNGGTRIVPARAPAGAPPVEVKVPVAPVAVPPPVTTAVEPPSPPAVVGGALARAEAQQELAVLAPARPQRPPSRAVPPAKQPAEAKAPDAKTKGQCKGTAVAKWYTAADGRRKYRCVRPEPAGYKIPAQLY